MHQHGTVTVLFINLNAQLAGSKQKSMFLISGPAISVSNIYMNLYKRPAALPDSDKGPSATAAIRQMGGASAGEMRAQFKGHANVKKRVLD